MVKKRTVKESLEGMEVYNKLGKLKSDSDYEGLSEGIVLCNVPSLILKSHMNPMICHEVESLIGQLANHVNVYADESGITVELEKVRNLDATTMCECYEQFESILFAPTAAILYKWDSVRKRYQSYPAQYAEIERLLNSLSDFFDVTE